MSGCPLHSYTPICLYAPSIHMSAQGCTHPHMFPILLYASVCSQRLLHVVGACKGPLTCWTLPLHLPCMGVPPLQFAPPSIFGFSASVCLGILMSYGDFSLLLGVFPHLLGVLGASAHGMPMCSFLYIFVVCYVSHFYYGYNYYSSSNSGIFWLVIGFISDYYSFADGVSSKLGSAWSGSTTTLDAKRLWRFIGSASVPQQQPPSSMPLLVYANYAMGSPQVGFFFRVEPPTILYIICLVSILVSAFYF